MSATNLLELAPDEIVSFVEGLGQPAYRGRQLATWIYVKGVADFGAMSDLPRELRDKLSAQAVIAPPTLHQRQVSRDGSAKLVLRLGDGQMVQSVVMPDRDRLTLCVSTQVGCGFGCAFCLTGTMGLVRNLTAGEIVAALNLCPHELAPVCKGKVRGTTLPSPPGEYRWGREGEILACPWHGWEFDLLTGRALADERVRLRRYPVTVEDDTIFVTI